MVSSSSVTQQAKPNFNELPVELKVKTLEFLERTNTVESEKTMARLGRVSKGMRAVLEENNFMNPHRKVRCDIFSGKANHVLIGPTHRLFTEGNIDTVKDAALDRLVELINTGEADKKLLDGNAHRSFTESTIATVREAAEHRTVELINTGEADKKLLDGNAHRSLTESTIATVRGAAEHRRALIQ